MGSKFSPADSGYVEVKDRIEKFYEKYPEGAIRTNIFDYRDDVVIVGAEVFANKADDMPVGTGFSALKIPGSTPFTKDSELENAETSAVGRAIAMAGFEVHRSVASADEIAMKAPAEDAEPTADLKSEVRELAEKFFGPSWKDALKSEYGVDGRSGVDKLNETLAALRDLELIETEPEVGSAAEDPF